MHWFVPLLYSIYLLIQVSAVVCHHQGAETCRNGTNQYIVLVISTKSNNARYEH
jgi:hypothetical protein